MSGHLGNLSDKQSEALNELRTRVNGSGEFKAGDDYECLRFLRARQFDVDKAYAQYTAYLKWFRDNNVADILNTLPAKSEMMVKIVAHAFHGNDKQGRPIYIEKSGSIHVEAVLATFTDHELLWGHVWGQQHSIRRAAEASTRLGKHIETFTSIMDLKGLHGGHRHCLRFTKAIAQCDQDYYPERMGALFIINAPWIFPVLWNIAKPWLDEKTRAKIHVLKDPRDLLEHIDADQLPTEYGGTCNTCPNAPDCVKQHDITDIVRELTQHEDKKDFTEQEIGARSNFILPLRCEAKNAVFGWYFKTVAHDISFAVKWVPRGQNFADVKEFVVNPARLSASKLAVQGSYTSRDAGTLHLIWDNSYSWFSGKTLCYTASVAEEGDMSTESKQAEGKTSTVTDGDGGSTTQS